MPMTLVTRLLAALIVGAGATALAVPAHATPFLPGFTRTGIGPDGGSLYRGTIPSDTAPRPLRPGYVYLPPGLSPDRRYPVVYLLHGMPGDPDEYATSLGLATVADDLIAADEVKPFIA